jgi:hypothetical protein
MRPDDPPGEFDRLVAAAWARIPGRFRRRMQNIALLTADEPPAISWRAAVSPAAARSSGSTKAVP